MLNQLPVSLYAALGFLALVGTAGLSLFSGAVDIHFGQVVSILASSLGLEMGLDYSQSQWAVITHIRLPRIILCVLVGAGLSISGAGLQGLFRNPLADPALIGVSGGAMAMVVVFIVASSLLIPAGASAQFAQVNGYLLPMAGFGGGLLTTYIVYQLATTQGYTSMPAMLLSGIAIGSLTSAIVGFVIFTADDAELRSITFWMLGSMSGADWTSVLSVAPFILIPVLVMPVLGKRLNALSVGDNIAMHSGVAVQSTKRWIILLSCMATGAAVCVSGLVGFVGLVVPHLVRLTHGADHRSLTVGSALLGAVILILADWAARTVAAPAEMPLGVVTALLGAPFFIWLVKRNSAVVDNA